jgi:lysophospholipase L1-like esterase
MIRPRKPPHQAEPPAAVEKPCSSVACLGSSSTAGKGQAFNWIKELQRRLGERRVTFRNFGVGGDLAYNALQRLSDVIASRPKKIVVFIGGNDVLTLVSTKARTFFRISKRLPRDPSPEWFRENLRAIVLRLKARPRAPVRFVRCLRSEKIQYPRTPSRVNSTAELRSSATLSAAWPGKREPTISPSMKPSLRRL